MAVLAAGGWFPHSSGQGWAQSQEAVPDSARKAVARRQELMDTVRQRLMRGDRLLAEGDAAGAYAEYRAALQACPTFALAQPLQAEAFAKYQMAARRHGDHLAQGGRLEEARQLMEQLVKDAQDAGISPRAVDEDTKRLMADLRDPEVYNPALTTTHVDRVKEVEKALHAAEGAIRIGDFDEASKHYAAVLGLDPTNSAARRGLQQVDEMVNQQYLTVARDHTRSKMLNEVSKSWESTVPRFDLKDNLPSEEMRMGKPAEAGSVRERLRTIIVPEVEFAETPIREALTFLSNRSQQLDPTGTGVNIVLRAKEESAGNKPVTISLRGAPLETVIDYVSRMAGMSYRVDGFAVTVIPAGDSSSSELVLKTYRVPPGFLSEGAMAAQGDPFGGAAADPFAAPGDKAKSTTLQPKLGAKEFLQKNGVVFPPGAMAQFNPETSTLMVRNTPDQIEVVESMVQSSFGNVTKLLRIDVKAVEIRQHDLGESGFDWLLGSFGVTDKVQMGGGTYGNVTAGAGNDFPLMDSAGNPIPNMPLTGALRSGNYAINRNAIDSLISQTQGVAQEDSRAAGVFSVSGLLTNPQFQAVYRGLSQHKGIDGLLTSSVVVRAGQTATVKNAREFIYPTDYEPPEIPDSVGVNPAIGGVILVGGFALPAPITPAHPTAFETRDVGAQMQVEGAIGSDGYTLNLTLTPEIVQFDGFVNYGSTINYVGTAIPYTVLMPVFSTKRATVTVDAYDGATLVIAGLVEERVERVNDKVPVMGDAPFLGQFFRQKSESSQKRALLFFVTPSIVDPSGKQVRDLTETVEAAPHKGNP